MSWNSSVYTNKGSVMVAELLSGRTLTIDKVTGGATAAASTDEQKAQETVLDEKQTFKLLGLDDATDTSGEVIGKRVKIQITNETLTEGYTLHQVGIFGKLDDGEDTLLIVMQDDRGIEMPSHADNADFEIELFAVMAVSNVANLHVEIDPNALATIEQLENTKTTLETQIATVQTNLDTAKSDLDGKIETVEKTYLPLSGGTLTGKLTAPAIIAPVVGSWNGVAAFWHNIPRAEPKDITSYVADGSLWNRIAGTNGYSLFEDIYVGDYIKMSRPISAYEQTGQYQITGSQYVTVAGIDTHMNVGDWPTDGSPTNITYHHLDMVPGQGFGGTQHFGRSRMNSTNTTEGGYVGSEMFKTTIGSVATSGSTASTASINQQLYAEFGSHLKTHRALLSNSLNETGYNRYGTNTGCTSNWVWTNVQAVLMTEIEVYGSIAWASSGYDIGCGKQQMPLFAGNAKAVNDATAWYWLRSVASASEFCCCSNFGYAGCNGASFASGYVRPRFIIA